jgi:hypothetical protein
MRLVPRIRTYGRDLERFSAFFAGGLQVLPGCAADLARPIALNH